MLSSPIFSIRCIRCLVFSSLISLAGCDQQTPVFTSIAPQASSDEVKKSAPQVVTDLSFLNEKQKEQQAGSSFTRLNDGRIVQICCPPQKQNRPEFDPYNSVTFFKGKNDFEIFRFPRSILRPMEVHTAVLVDNFIYILGYREKSFGKSGKGVVKVYRLDLDLMKIKYVDTRGGRPVNPDRLQATYHAEEHAIMLTSSKFENHINPDIPELIEAKTEYKLDLAEGYWEKQVEEIDGPKIDLTKLYYEKQKEKDDEYKLNVYPYFFEKQKEAHDKRKVEPSTSTGTE